MAIVRVFPMRDGPPIPYALAEIILKAHQRCHGAELSLAKISEAGGFAWGEVPLIFGQVRKKDRLLHQALMYEARSMQAESDSDVVHASRVEVINALEHAPVMPAEVLIPEMRDHWAEQNARPVDAPLPVQAPDTQLTIVCWKWHQENYKTRFTSEQVNILGRMVKRHYKTPHRMVCITDNPKGITEMETLELWKDHAGIPNVSGKHLPSCYRRLKIFSKEVGELLRARRIISLDLDIVLTGNVTHIFDRPDPFVGWKVPGVHVAEVYNGSIFLFDVGPYSWIWETFDQNKSPQLAKQAGYQGSDQGWISYCLKAREPGWGRHDGVYSYPREVRHAIGLPQGARLVIFHGQRKPWDARYSRDRAWIQKHYL